MSPLRRSLVPIASAAELSLWWAEALSEHTTSGQALSLLWLDSCGHRLGRVLSLTDAPPQPTPAVLGLIRQLRRTMVTEGPLHLQAHTAIALSRPGTASIAGGRGVGRSSPDGRRRRRPGTWSFHVAAGDWITTLVDPPATRFHPRRVAWRSPAELLDRNWLADQN